jgi:adenosylcobyric acid synthase
MTARTLMVQGTFSSAGKSLLVAALCRIFARRGVRVAPFKSQNMSNNAAVCADGAEIGRAQAMQAAAAGIEPTCDMNPILLKPEAQARSQVIVSGRPWKTLPARGYYAYRDELWPVITSALDRLRSQFDLVVIEGAGSPAELNLRGCDMANMAVARYARAPVLLAGDIDRGGVFAQLLGTLDLLEPEERRCVRGLIVNKFRGDRSLFDDGVRILEERGRVPVLGVVPYLPALAIPEEDSAGLIPSASYRDIVANGNGQLDIAVIRLPCIANFDDFDPLAAEPGVRLRYVESVAALGQPAAVIVPGTKSTMADQRWLEEQGLADAIRQLAANGTAVVGICGGYQILGRVIRDPHEVESSTGQWPGLGLLPVETTFAQSKSTSQVEAEVLSGPAWLSNLRGTALAGYEIHMGRTTSEQPWLAMKRAGESLESIVDGAISHDGRVWGCYLHGLFANDQFRRAWLASLDPPHAADQASTAVDQNTSTARFHGALDRLADAVEQALDMQRLETILAEGIQ